MSLLVLSLGGQWAALQWLAWARMLVVYSRERSLTEAVSLTLDGRHPCSLCHAARKGQEEQRQRDRSSPNSSKLELGLPQHRCRLPGPMLADVAGHVAPLSLPSLSPEPPPKPPPRRC